MYKMHWFAAISLHKNCSTFVRTHNKTQINTGLILCPSLDCSAEVGQLIKFVDPAIPPGFIPGLLLDCSTEDRI